MNNESEIIARAASGDTAAFRLIVDGYKNMVFDIALRMSANTQDAEDLTQSAFVKIYFSLKRYDVSRKFSTWVYTIALNTARNHIKRKSILRFFSLDGDGEEFDNLPDPDISAIEKILAQTRAQEIEDALNKMPMPLKETFIPFYLHDKSVSETAQITALSENAVKLRLMRARKYLQSKLAEN
ncbi:MAG: RNA polymerase sigma factor [Elusimicrobia bacterium]|nr:RNA polymerase sigma factor [Elusimicrobiota bacterium]